VIRKTLRLLIFFIVLCCLALPASSVLKPAHQTADFGGIYIRVNLVGYHTAKPKAALAFSSASIEGSFALMDAADDQPVCRCLVRKPESQVWGSFSHHAELDFGACRSAGRYYIRHTPTGAQSPVFRIDSSARAELPDILLEFMRQQRCGYNPFLDAVCHPFDGRTAYGPMPNASYLDARGGWHDAGDQLKYLITSSNATAQMLLAYRLAPELFKDRFNNLGQPGPNGIPDVLDEARWGLDWMLKLHPAPDQLYHQVADDRDHSGWRLPQNDASDYGWGPGSYRVAYFATGRPQGLGKFQSEATGVANLAGRYAAAMALAYLTWKDSPQHGAYAQRCLQAGIEVYRLGKKQEGFQQGNSFGAPYRYNEDTWADDMEWGAAEIHRATGRQEYLEDAKRYAQVIAGTSWMGRDTAAHYQYYPFMNLGHFALHDVADQAFRKLLESYYRDGLDKCLSKGVQNPYFIGVPFIWCSNNLVVALATQAHLYERMTRDSAYRRLADAHRDWLFGRNPWGTSMFTGIPDGGAFPRDPHLIVTNLTGRPVRGGLVDGPVVAEIFLSLKGVSLSRPDPFALFQSNRAVYHDDLKDYSTNEPTMDGTASAILLLAIAASSR